MFTPNFVTSEDVRKFLMYGGDEWCRPMVEEYMDLIACTTPIEELDIEELNGWLEHELSSATQGYEEWGNDV